MPHPTDRRAFAVTLTDKARDLLPALDAQGRAQEAEITKPLTAQESRGTAESTAADLGRGGPDSGRAPEAGLSGPQLGLAA